MCNEVEQNRMNTIYKMIFEMATGNFAFRIPRTGNDDELEGLSILLNWTVEELQESVFHAGFVNPHRSYKHLVESKLVVDENFILKNCNANASSLLGFKDNEVLNVDFRSLLLKESVSLWESASNDMQQNESFSGTLSLEFVCVNNLIIPASCSISRLFGSTDLHISFFSAKVTNMLENSLKAKRILTAEEQRILNYLDVKKTQAVYDHILANTDSAIPTVKELSRLFGTNENKLKSSFRYLFKMTIHQFHNDRRLQRAQFLILNTEISLKTIAVMIGFPTYPSFSRAFKIKFKYSPSDVVRSATIT
jgi:AraC-like DNA-binding protein